MWRVAALLALAAAAAADCDEDLTCKYYTLPDFARYFNSRNYTYRVGSMSDHPSMKVVTPDTIKLSLDTSNYRPHGPEILRSLPKSFDAREKWPHCPSISKIHNQGGCGSCWTFGTANTATDRTCIHKNLTHVELSPQDLQCCEDCYSSQVCEGGSAVRAFQFWLEHGLVSTACRPYNLSNCDLFTKHPCAWQCADPSVDYRADKHFAERVYQVPPDVDQIKAELVVNGPIEAAIDIYEDFRMYSSGIFQHLFGFLKDSHSVRLIGYGTERGVDYWLVANSWGNLFQEKGFFRIKQRTEGFENNLYTGMPAN